MAPGRLGPFFMVFLIAAIFKTVTGDECVQKCDNGVTCVTKAMRCDSFPDCVDLADEEGCRDGCDGLPCANGQCIANDQHCDGHVDCLDDSDENECTKDNYRLNHPTLSDKELCMRPCRYGKCAFGQDNKSECVCFEGFSGNFCKVGSFDEVREPQVIVHSHNESDNDVITRHEDSLDKTFKCEAPQGYVKSQLVCDGKFDCDDRTDEIDCTRIDYRHSQNHLPEKDLCIMPCHAGRCKFDLADRAHCKCPDNYNGTFCDISLAPMTEPTMTTKYTSIDQPDSTTPNTKPDTVTTIHPDPRDDDSDSSTTASTSAVENSTTMRSKSASTDAPSEMAAEGSSTVSLVVIPLLVVAAVGTLLYCLMKKPFKKLRYENNPA